MGIVLGVLICAAVLLFHSHHIRRQCCSREKRERFRQLKQRYKDETLSWSNSNQAGDIPLTDRNKSGDSVNDKNYNNNDSPKVNGADPIKNILDKTEKIASSRNSKVNPTARDVSEDDRSDGDYNYSHVIDVNL